MNDDTLRRVRNHLEAVEDTSDPEERLYFVREARQLLVATEEDLEGKRRSIN